MFAAAGMIGALAAATVRGFKFVERLGMVSGILQTVAAFGALALAVALARQQDPQSDGEPRHRASQSDRINFLRRYLPAAAGLAVGAVAMALLPRPFAEGPPSAATAAGGHLTSDSDLSSAGPRPGASLSTPEPRSNADASENKIVIPQKGAIIPRCIIAQGQLSPANRDRGAWLILRAAANSQAPLYVIARAEPSSDGSFETSEIDIGGGKGSGFNFVLMLVTANDARSQDFTRRLNADTAENDITNLGTQLPPGAKLLADVKFTRDAQDYPRCWAN
jgi:hypothetical protein